MKQLFSIGEMAKIFNLNVRTLRYYDDIGLLIPDKVDEDTGYRYYGSAQFERADTIKYLRALDMPISQIKRFFDNSDISEMTAIMEEQEAEIRRKQEQLERIENKISNRLEQLKRAETQGLGKIEHRTIPPRELAIIRTEVTTIDDITVNVSGLRDKSMREAVVFQGKIGLSINRENILAGKFDKYDEVFIILDPADPYEGERDKIEGGEYITIMFNGSHDKAARYYRKLLNYMSENGLELADDSVEISIIDSGITNDESKFISELQLKVK